MGESEREAWLHAAWLALRHLPDDLIERGAKAAMQTADHPSKILPAIMAEVAGSYRAREVIHGSNRPPRPLPLPAPVETEEEKAERLEVAALMAKLVRKLDANA